MLGALIVQCRQSLESTSMYALIASTYFATSTRHLLAYGVLDVRGIKSDAVNGSSTANEEMVFHFVQAVLNTSTLSTAGLRYQVSGQTDHISIYTFIRRNKVSVS